MLKTHCFIGLSNEGSHTGSYLMHSVSYQWIMFDQLTSLTYIIKEESETKMLKT